MEVQDKIKQHHMLVGVDQVAHFKSKPYEVMGHNVILGIGSSIRNIFIYYCTYSAPDPDSSIKP